MDTQKFDKICVEYGNPYHETSFNKAASIKEILGSFLEEKEVSAAGRITALRGHGKSCFSHISDVSGKIQIYARADIMNEGFNYFKEFDIGDIIGIQGKFFKTHTGEPTILVSKAVLLAKAFHTLPEKWHGLKDVETRYRQRYLDLISNPDAREVFQKRCKIINAIRQFFIDKGYFEVETPMLHPIPGGAAGRPFITHHNATSSDVYLRIAPELYLKRLLVGGFDRVFEINKSFRNEGISVRHSPEFTMLEAYCAYFDYIYMINLCEELICKLVKEQAGSCILEYQGKQIDFTPPWPRVSFAELFKKEFDIDPADSQKILNQKVCQKMGMPEKNLSRTQLLNITEELIEKHYPSSKPAFVVDFFSWTSPLAKAKKDNPHILERFELFIAGMEVANSYSELNNPIEQKQRFLEQLKDETELPKKMDDDFVTSLEYGMPPATGLGIGIDRMIMIILNQSCIRDVILFPLLKPQEEADQPTPENK
jgi:lysyl-tRNA synthetase, class II